LVEDPPLLSVPWLAVLDSQSELVSSDVLVPEEGSLRSHSSLELELDSIFQWLSWPALVSLVNPPGLVETVVAVVEDDVSVVSVAVSMDIEALSSVVLEVSSGSTVPSDLVVLLVSVRSDDSWSVDVESLTVLVGNHV